MKNEGDEGAMRLDGILEGHRQGMIINIVSSSSDSGSSYSDEHIK